MTLEELTDEISNVLYDSLEMDWSTTDGAKALVANVPAINALPELLEALGELADLAFHHMPGGYGHAVDNAYHAIAKARGR